MVVEIAFKDQNTRKLVSCLILVYNSFMAERPPQGTLVVMQFEKNTFVFFEKKLFFMTKKT